MQNGVTHTHAHTQPFIVKDVNKISNAFIQCHELQYSEVFTAVRVKIELNSSSVGLPQPQHASTCAAGLAWMRVEA